MYIYMYNSLKACLLINPQRMCRRVMVVVLYVYVSVCYYASYYVPHLCRKCHRVLYDVFVLWLLLKTLCSKVLASFADYDCLSRFLMSSPWTEETAMASFQQD